MTLLGDSAPNYSTQMFTTEENPFEARTNLEQDTNTIFCGYKRPAEMRDGEGAPRAKRRFDRVSAQLENFRIDRDEDCQIEGSSGSSDEEMDDAMGTQETVAVVEEPDDEPVKWKRIRLDERLHQYLQRAKDGRQDLWPKFKQIQGNELVIYRPTNINPFDDPSMHGRILELSDSDAMSAHFLLSGPAPTVSYPEEESDGDSQNGDSIPDTHTRSNSPTSTLESARTPPVITELCSDQLSPMSSLASSTEDIDMDFD